jgi:hypothetical protein
LRREIVKAYPPFLLFLLFRSRSAGAFAGVGADKRYIMPRIDRHTPMANDRLKDKLEVAKKWTLFFYSFIGYEVGQANVKWNVNISIQTLRSAVRGHRVSFQAYTEHGTLH